MNTTDFLSIATAICPDKAAIIFEDKILSYAQLTERVNRLANALAGLGVKKGDRVAIVQVNSPTVIETYFAVARLGGIFVPLNFRAKGSELAYMLNSAEANVFLVGDRYLDLVDTIRTEAKTVKHYISLDKPKANYLTYEDIVAHASTEEIYTDIGDTDTTILMYTAGTTGFPKGVMLPHNSFSVYVLENVTPASPDTDEKNILTVPLYHVAGVQAMMAAIYGGRTLVMERQFDPKDWMGLVQKWGVSRAMMVPTMLKQLLDNPDFSKYDLSSLKVITYGAAPMPLNVIKRAIEAFPGVGFINAFGQTETASTVTSLGPEDHVITGTLAEREKKLVRLSSIGKPMSDIEMKVIDESGHELGPNQVGEIVARGPRVMAGYWKDAEKTAKTIDPEGWVHTNDMGYRDEGGYYFLSGRITDMIKRGGELIAPEEVELVLATHPNIDEVAVIGVPDEEWGEQPRAICVPKAGTTLTPEEVIEYCRTRLSSFKRPRSVIFVESLPRNPMGKVLKKDLRATYGQE